MDSSNKRKIIVNEIDKVKSLKGGFRDAGYQFSKADVPIGTLSTNKKRYPYISINSQSLPEIKKWEVGKDYYITLKVKQESFTEDMDRATSSLKVMSIKVL